MGDTVDVFSRGRPIPLSVVPDPSNSGQFVIKVDAGSGSTPNGAATAGKQDTGNTALAAIQTSSAASATAAKQDTLAGLVGTPGTGEPAHAGGSTGLIGWARDILAKIAAFGTTGEPSADVLSVQYPNAYVGKATLGALNAALTVDTLGASQIGFYFPQGTTGCNVVVEATNSNAGTPVWVITKYLRTFPASQIYGLNYGVQQPHSSGDTILVDCVAASQIRLRISTFGSAFEVLAHRSFCPSVKPIFAELSNQNTIPVTTPIAIVYEDTLTPLAGGATFTGSTRLVAEGNNYFNARANSDVASAAGSVVIEETPDVSVNWRLAASGSVWGAGSSLVLRITKTGDATYRIRYTNGGAAQAWLLITSSQTPT